MLNRVSPSLGSAQRQRWVDVLTRLLKQEDAREKQEIIISKIEIFYLADVNSRSTFAEAAGAGKSGTTLRQLHDVTRCQIPKAYTPRVPGVRHLFLGWKALWQPRLSSSFRSKLTEHEPLVSE